MRNRKSKTAPHAQPAPGEIPPNWVKHVYCPEHACRRARACRARNKKLSCKSRRKHIPEADREKTFKEMQKAMRMTHVHWILDIACRQAAGEPVRMPTSREIDSFVVSGVYSERRHIFKD